MKLAMKHMLSDFMVLLLAQHATQRILQLTPLVWHELTHWARGWRPEPFAEWPRQREW